MSIAGTGFLKSIHFLGRFWGSDVGIYKKNGINFKLKEFVEAVRDIAQEENIPLVDHFNEWLSLGPRA
jgi:hypothetical protein